ncbi:hypothetical protein QO010_002044 [Caulobacter ginsengisoli]|uniref:GDSL family lipase n=1 Tax=Caulobacter ginsengisoli TaxID=400775 RepID=A0ABU0ISX0_9CAUL|nr:GDSL-type esterase/lipase family protein [Caulobacter ginsengisoli]MDQ0464263.1 hypothetical protein [Caulobacter ginsengisoli]
MAVFVVGLMVGAALGVMAGAVGMQMLVDQQGPPLVEAKKPLLAQKAEPTQPLLQTVKVTPGQPVVIGVFGDSMGDGLWAGLYRQLHDDKGYEVIRFSQASTGLARYDYIDIQKQTEKQLEGRRLDVAIVLFGANDEQGIIANGQVLPFASDGWKQVYGQRIDNLTGLLREHGAAVYWVGLPRMKRPDYDRRAGVLNSVYAERAAALGMPFLDLVPATINDKGEYEAYLVPEGDDRPRLMRAKDGIHMTMAGYLRIARPVTDRLRADVDAALAAAGPASVSSLASAPASPPPSGR